MAEYFLDILVETLSSDLTSWEDVCHDPVLGPSEADSIVSEHSAQIYGNSNGTMLPSLEPVEYTIVNGLSVEGIALKKQYY